MDLPIPPAAPSRTPPAPPAGGAAGPRAVQAGPYLDDLLAQPRALLATLDALAGSAPPRALVAGLAAGRFDRVVLTGMGSSLHALYPLHLALLRRGLATQWQETAELLLDRGASGRPGTALIALSQSGESAEIVRLSARADAFGHLFGITNSPGSTLARNAHAHLTLAAGREATVSCKTYLASLAAVHWLQAHLTTGDPGQALAELAEAVPALGRYLLGWREHVAALLPLVEGVESVFVTGRGTSLATAGAGGLILKEATRRHAEGMSAAAFRHGPLEMAGERVLVLIFAGDDATAALHQRLAADVRQGGGRALLIGDHPGHPVDLLLPPVAPAVRHLMEMLPVQMLSLAIAARDGIEAGRFQRASKVTVIA